MNIKDTHELQTKINNLSLKPFLGELPPIRLVISDKTLEVIQYEYIKEICHEINGCYSHGWYNACAVMIRKLAESSIIELYLSFNMIDRIKNDDGGYISFKDIIDKVKIESSWHLSKTTKSILSDIKKNGDKAAHSPRCNLHESDIRSMKSGIKDLLQDLWKLIKERNKSEHSKNKEVLSM